MQFQSPVRFSPHKLRGLRPSFAGAERPPRCSAGGQRPDRRGAPPAAFRTPCMVLRASDRASPKGKMSAFGAFCGSAVWEPPLHRGWGGRKPRGDGARLLAGRGVAAVLLPTRRVKRGEPPGGPSCGVTGGKRPFRPSEDLSYNTLRGRQLTDPFLPPSLLRA